MAKVKSLDCQLQISKLTTLLQMNVKFYAVLSQSFCMVLILYLFQGPLPDQSLRKSSNFFSEAIKTPKLLFSNVMFSSYIFHSANHNTDRRPLVKYSDKLCIQRQMVVTHIFYFMFCQSSSLSTVISFVYKDKWWFRMKACQLPSVWKVLKKNNSFIPSPH